MLLNLFYQFIKFLFVPYTIRSQLYIKRVQNGAPNSLPAVTMQELKQAFNRVVTIIAYGSGLVGTSEKPCYFGFTFV
jgi:hypothetical protein